MLVVIISTILWVIYSSLDGVTQGYYYDLYPSERGHKNMHPHYTIQRIIVLIPLFYNVYADYGIWNAAIFSIGLGFMFSFFHNGFYYITRHKLNNKIYPKGFFDQSETSTSFIELGAKFRTAMLGIGILFIIGVILEIAK